MNKKVVVIYLKRKSMEVFSVVRGDKVAQAEVDWNGKNLEEKLRLIKERFETDRVRILLADKIAYLWVRPIKVGEEITRQKLEKEMEAEFPEAVGSMWDWAKAKDEDGEVALVFAPVQEVFDKVMQASAKVKLIIEDVEPERFALRRGDDPVVEIAEKNLKAKDEEVLSMKVEEIDISNKQEKVLEPISELVSDEVEKKSISWKQVGLIVGGVIILGGLVVGGVWRVKQANKIVSKPKDDVVVVSPMVSPSPSPLPTATPKPVNWEQVSIQVLNGSGISGKAGEIAGVLAGKLNIDEAEIETGNADNYDYEGVEIRVKDGVQDGVYDVLEEMFLSHYEVSEGQQLSESVKFDAIVIVGSERD